MSTNRIFFHPETNSRYDNDGFIKNTLVIYSPFSSYGIGKLKLIICDNRIIDYESDFEMLTSEYTDEPNVRSFINNFYKTIINNPNIRFKSTRLNLFI